MTLRHLEIQVDQDHMYVTAIHVFFDLPTGRIGEMELRTNHLQHTQELADRVMTRLYPNRKWSLERMTCNITHGRIQNVQSFSCGSRRESNKSALNLQDWTQAETNELQSICDLAIRGLNQA